MRRDPEKFVEAVEGGVNRDILPEPFAEHGFEAARGFGFGRHGL
jgi:hypothetical protein